MVVNAHGKPRASHVLKCGHRGWGRHRRRARRELDRVDRIRPGLGDRGLRQRHHHLALHRLAAALLVGLLGNALAGAWWPDPVVGLGIAALAVSEGREAWRGEGCCASGGST
jgi:hypothetical protein